MRLDTRGVTTLRAFPIVLGVVFWLLPLGAEAKANKCDELPPWGQTIKDAKKRFVPVLPVSGAGFTFPAGYCDQETGLVWQARPGETNRDNEIDEKDKVDWDFARLHCASIQDGERMGWRLPSFVELASLMDLSLTFPPFLPPGHQFVGVRSDFYWSKTAFTYPTFDPSLPSRGWIVDFRDATVFSSKRSEKYFVWCVRGPMNADTY